MYAGVAYGLGFMHLCDMMVLKCLQPGGKGNSVSGAQACLPGAAPAPAEHPALLCNDHCMLPTTGHLQQHMRLSVSDSCQHRLEQCPLMCDETRVHNYTLSY